MWCSTNIIVLREATTSNVLCWLSASATTACVMSSRIIIHAKSESMNHQTVVPESIQNSFPPINNFEKIWGELKPGGKCPQIK